MLTDDEKRELIAEGRGWVDGKAVADHAMSAHDTIRRLADALEGTLPEDDEPCKAETHSWIHYRPEQIDSYWIRCTQLGKHDRHEDSHTGLTWGGA